MSTEQSNTNETIVQEPISYFDDVNVEIETPEDDENTFQNKLLLEKCNNVLTFGKKHKGRTYREVYVADKNYIKWICSQKETSGPLSKYKDWIEEYTTYVENTEGIIGSGKYVGYSYDHVLFCDPGYCAWIVKNINKEDSDLFIFKDYLKDKEIVVPPSPTVGSTNDNLESSTIDGNSTLKTGKHSGKTFQEVLETEPSYCEYMLKSGKGLPDFRSWLATVKIPSPNKDSDLGEVNVIEPKDDSIITTGKFEGATFLFTMESDPGFCKYILKSKLTNKSLIAFKSYLAVNFKDVGDAKNTSTSTLQQEFNIAEDEGDVPFNVLTLHNKIDKKKNN